MTLRWKINFFGRRLSPLELLSSILTPGSVFIRAVPAANASNALHHDLSSGRVQGTFSRGSHGDAASVMVAVAIDRRIYGARRRGRLGVRARGRAVALQASQGRLGVGNIAGLDGILEGFVISARLAVLATARLGIVRQLRLQRGNRLLADGGSNTGGYAR